MNFDWSVVGAHRDALAAATGTTVLLTVATMAIAVPCGIVVAALRLYAWTPVRAVATAYVELFRNLPLILVVYWAFYVLPIATGLGLSPFATGLAALALNVTAYNAETFRAGIGSIRRGQLEAAMALGMSRAQALRRIVLPQAVRRILPVLASTLGVAVQRHLARLGDRGQRARVRGDADTRPDVSRARDAHRDGRGLLAARLSASEARRLDPTPLRGD